MISCVGTGALSTHRRRNFRSTEFSIRAVSGSDTTSADPSIGSQADAVPVPEEVSGFLALIRCVSAMVWMFCEFK